MPSLVEFVVAYPINNSVVDPPLFPRELIRELGLPDIKYNKARNAKNAIQRVLLYHFNNRLILKFILYNSHAVYLVEYDDAIVHIE